MRNAIFQTSNLYSDTEIGRRQMYTYKSQHTVMWNVGLNFDGNDFFLAWGCTKTVASR
jgi:hypothetical protein